MNMTQFMSQLIPEQRKLWQTAYKYKIHISTRDQTTSIFIDMDMMNKSQEKCNGVYCCTQQNFIATEGVPEYKPQITIC
jgi:hypothetical protein